MSWFTKLCNFFKRRRGKIRLDKLDPKQPAQNILTLLTAVKEQGFEQYTIRRAMQRTVETYSEDVSQLMEWIDWVYVTIDARDYVSDRWKSVKATVATRVLDDYLSNAGHDIHPEAFTSTYTRRLESICTYLASKDKEEEYRIKYYTRNYNPVLKDTFNLLLELYRLTDR